MGKAHVFYSLEAVRSPNRLKAEVAIVGAKAQRELNWWLGALEESKLSYVPAPRHSVPALRLSAPRRRLLDGGGSPSGRGASMAGRVLE